MIHPDIDGLKNEDITVKLIHNDQFVWQNSSIERNAGCYVAHGRLLGRTEFCSSQYAYCEWKIKIRNAQYPVKPPGIYIGPRAHVIFVSTVSEKICNGDKCNPAPQYRKRKNTDSTNPISKRLKVGAYPYTPDVSQQPNGSLFFNIVPEEADAFLPKKATMIMMRNNVQDKIYTEYPTDTTILLWLKYKDPQSCPENGSWKPLQSQSPTCFSPLQFQPPSIMEFMNIYWISLTARAYTSLAELNDVFGEFSYINTNLENLATGGAMLFTSQEENTTSTKGDTDPSMFMSMESIIDDGTPNEEDSFPYSKYHNLESSDTIDFTKHSGHRIHWSALLSDVRYVQYWIEQRDEDVNVKDAYGITPLHLAVWAGNYNVAKYLSDKGANSMLQDKNGKTPLDLANENEEMKSLLTDYIKRNEDVLSTNLTKLDELSSTYADDGATTPNDNMSNKSGDDSHTSKKKRTDLPDPIAFPEYSSHRIHWSALLSDVRYVQYWIEQRDEDVNVKDAYGITPLHLAVWAGNFEVVEYLLSKGANPNLQDKNKKTPLSIAEENKDQKTVELIRQHIMKWIECSQCGKAPNQKKDGYYVPDGTVHGGTVNIKNEPNTSSFNLAGNNEMIKFSPHSHVTDAKKPQFNEEINLLEDLLRIILRFLKVKSWSAFKQCSKASNCMGEEPNIKKAVWHNTFYKKQNNLLLAWNVIEGTENIKLLQMEFPALDPQNLRYAITRILENNRTSISDAVGTLTCGDKNSQIVKCFKWLISLEHSRLLELNKFTVDQDMSYLFFIQILGACREILSKGLKNQPSPQTSNIYEEKGKNVQINDKVVIKQSKKKAGHRNLEEMGLKVSTINEKLQGLLIDNGVKMDDLHEIQSRNLFRNCVCYELCCSKCEEPILHTEEQRKFVDEANRHISIEDLKRELTTTLRLCKAQKNHGIFGEQEEEAKETIYRTVSTIEKLVADRPLKNLVNLLYTLNTAVLKQRKNRSCKEKAQNMNAILNAAPELLQLPKILGLDAKDFKDLDCIYDEYMDQLLTESASKSIVGLNINNNTNN
eukprot:TRINITY_DN715_c0_g1_i1.p1 TRINITY_DN715_c0_g1~~TRINITY_DN715_c0_g1_i1.p1  ORF type:complete len:1046 (-),score=26.95 TRINITY_DN715_c0_g1_i1:103-3240(-)